MQFQMEQAVDVLRDTPGVLNALLRGKSAVWLSCRKTPESFSPVDVIGHLMLGEMTDWIPRVLMILDSQESRAFDPFDRFAFQALIEGKPIDTLLDEFAELRRKSLERLRDVVVNEEQLELRGMHPELGSVTLGNLLATWVVHDLGHIAQVVKAMSSEYREAVGPCRQYLSILD